jgi:hypothetical protein
LRQEQSQCVTTGPSITADAIPAARIKLAKAKVAAFSTDTAHAMEKRTTKMALARMMKPRNGWRGPNNGFCQMLFGFSFMIFLSVAPFDSSLASWS